MNNLPVELIINIVDRLDLQNKLKCRRLSKKFLNVIDNFLENKRLYITTRKKLLSRRIPSIMCHKNSISVSRSEDMLERFYDLSFLLKNRYFKNIKFLSIDLNEFDKIDVNILNHFNCIEVLQFHDFVPLTCLMLPKLKVLQFPYFKFCVCADNLQGSFAQHISFIDSGLNLANIQEIENFFYFEWLKKCEPLNFKNLKFFTTDLSIFRETTIDWIDWFSKIPTLEIFNLLLPFYSNRNFDSGFDGFFNSDRSYHSKIYMNGIPFDKFSNEFIKILKSGPFEAGFQTINDNMLDFFLTNNSLIREVFPIDAIDLSSCEDYFLKDKVPKNFLKKFVVLKSVKVSKKVDKKVLINILLEYNIKKIELINSSLDPEFYSSLNRYAPDLNSIRIKDKLNILNNIDFSLFDSFKLLREFEIEHSLSLKFLDKFIDKFVDFYVSFNIFHKDISIDNKIYTLKESCSDNKNFSMWLFDNYGSLDDPKIVSKSDFDIGDENEDLQRFFQVTKGCMKRHCMCYNEYETGTYKLQYTDFLSKTRDE